MPDTLVGTVCKLYNSLVSPSTTGPLAEVNDICYMECLTVLDLLLAALLMSNFNVNTVVEVGCEHWGKTSFLHGREYFACDDYGTAHSPTVSTPSENKVLCDGYNSMIVFIFKDVHWNFAHWKLEVYTCRELKCL